MSEAMIAVWVAAFTGVASGEKGRRKGAALRIANLELITASFGAVVRPAVQGAWGTAQHGAGIGVARDVGGGIAHAFGRDIRLGFDHHQVIQVVQGLVGEDARILQVRSHVRCGFHGRGLRHGRVRDGAG